MRRLAAAFALVAVAACARSTGGLSGEGPADDPEAFFAACWPAEVPPGAAVKLTFLADGNVVAEPAEGTDPAVGRCLREASGVVRWAQRPDTLEVRPPTKRHPAWAMLEWVKRADAVRFTASRGVLDPAPLVAACFGLEPRARPNLSAVVTPSPVHRVVLQLDGVPVVPQPGAEVCIEAVLGATAWPSSRVARLNLVPGGGPAPMGEVAHYAPLQGSPGKAHESASIREAMVFLQPSVGVCWEEALARRAGLGGARGFRFRTDAGGKVVQVAVEPPQAASDPVAADVLLDGCLVRALYGARLMGGGAGEGAYSWLFADRAAR